MKHKLPANFPTDAAYFTRTDFGGYGPRGYNPSQIAGVLRDIPIEYLTKGDNNASEHLAKDKSGSAGSMLVIQNKDKKQIGSIFIPSPGTFRDFNLVYVPTKIN